MTATFKCLTTSFQVFQSGKHIISEHLGIMFARKTQTVSLTLVTPLVKSWSCFVD